MEVRVHSCSRPKEESRKIVRNRRKLTMENQRELTMENQRELTTENQRELTMENQRELTTKNQRELTTENQRTDTIIVGGNERNKIGCPIKMKKKTRTLKRSRHRRLNRKKLQQQFDHDNFMNYHLDSTNSNNHCLGIINKKDYHRLKDNLILFHKPQVLEATQLSRKINYAIKSIGKNIKIDRRKNDILIKFRETKKRFLMIVIQQKDLMQDSRISKFDMIHSSHHNKHKNEKNEYLILMQCGDYYHKNLEQDQHELSLEDINDIKNVVPNQISKEKHFGSVGDVYSIGYSAKYCIKNELSFDWFVTSK